MQASSPRRSRKTEAVLVAVEGTTIDPLHIYPLSTVTPVYHQNVDPSEMVAHSVIAILVVRVVFIVLKVKR